MKLKSKAIDAFAWGIKEGRLSLDVIPQPYRKAVKEALNK